MGTPLGGNEQALRALLGERRSPLLFCEAHSGLSAILAQQARGRQGRRFDGLWVSSLTDSVLRGLPDREVVSLRERAETVSEIAAAVRLPILVDCDTGGTVEQLRYGARRLAQAGASGIVVEDKRGAKENSLRVGAAHELEEPEVFAEKLAQATEDLPWLESLVLARLESLVCGETMDDALDRAQIYCEEGKADGVVIHSKREEPDEVVEFARRFRERCPRERYVLGCIPTVYNRTPLEYIASAGFQIVIFANHLLRASAYAMEATAAALLTAGRGQEVEPTCVPVRRLFEIVEGER